MQKENRKLKNQLDKANIAYDSESIFDERIESAVEYDPDQGERIIGKYITEKLAKKFFAMFWGRIDVYAKRGKNGGYFPQCNHRWNAHICPKQHGEKTACENCEHTAWTALTPKKVMEHLLGYKEDGSDVIGVYPLLPEGTCRFLVFDFDNHEKGAEKTDFANTDEAWHEEVDALNLMPGLQNQIWGMAAFDNPKFYKNRRLGYSNYYNFSAVYMGRDEEGYICLPRGLRESLIERCTQAGIEYELEDVREKGRPIHVSFKGDLRMQQDLAADRLLAYDHGVLSAATAFGKTVVCSYLISERKVNTLILLHNKDLIDQ